MSEYRDGEPSAEAVRAHEARGGLWHQRIVRDGGRIASAVVKMWVGFDSEVNGCGGLPLRARDERVSYRPCDVELTPVPWPDLPVRG